MVDLQKLRAQIEAVKAAQGRGAIVPIDFLETVLAELTSARQGAQA